MTFIRGPGPLQVRMSAAGTSSTAGCPPRLYLHWRSLPQRRWCLSRARALCVLTLPLLVCHRDTLDLDSRRFMRCYQSFRLSCSNVPATLFALSFVVRCQRDNQWANVRRTSSLPRVFNAASNAAHRRLSYPHTWITQTCRSKALMRDVYQQDVHRRCLARPGVPYRQSARSLHMF
jgi:hypothetical protein